MVYLGQTRAKKISDLSDYDVVITTHAVRQFRTRLQVKTELGDQTLVAEWHNMNFEEIWAKKKINSTRRKSRQNGFIVEDEDHSSALKAIKKRKNKPGTRFWCHRTSEELTVLQPGFCTRSRFECCWPDRCQPFVELLLQWHRVVVDEAHYIRNKSTSRLNIDRNATNLTRS